MRPKQVTPRRIILLLIAVTVFSGLTAWGLHGFKLPFGKVPSTAGKIVFVSNRAGADNLWMMDAATGANAVALTEGKYDDQEPAFSLEGDMVTLTSVRGGDHRQVYVTNAQVGSTVQRITATSSTKERPFYGPDGRVYFLDAGKLSAFSPDNSATTAIFPTAELLRHQLSDVFRSGGLTRAEVSPDSKQIAAVLKLEEGQALLLYLPEQDIVVTLGSAERVFCHFKSDNTLVAAFSGGSPFQKPLALLTPETLKVESYTAPGIVSPSGAMRGINVIAQFSNDGAYNVASASPVPFPFEDFVVSPDGALAVVAANNTPPAVGLFVVPLSNEGQVRQLAESRVETPVWSPDSHDIAFVAGKDIFSAPVDGSAPPKNLTGGKGNSTSPVWSPAKPKT